MTSGIHNTHLRNGPEEWTPTARRGGTADGRRLLYVITPEGRTAAEAGR